MMPQPQATPAPLRDIAGPVELINLPLGLVIAGVCCFLALALFLFWWFGARRVKRVLAADEVARRSLLKLQEAQLSTYEFGIGVSEVLRTFIRDVYQLNAVNQTSLEFLNSLRGNSEFTEAQKQALVQFLDTTDHIKYARGEAAEAQIQQLFSTAEQVVESGRARIQKEQKK